MITPRGGYMAGQLADPIEHVRGAMPRLSDGFVLAPHFMAAYPDPIEPAVNVSDYLHMQTMDLEARTVTWADATDSAPSSRQLRWTIPPVGLVSRIAIDVDGGSSTGYDFTAGGGTGAVEASGRGPYHIVENVQLRINGGIAVFDCSGFGAMLIEAAESVESLPQTQGVGAVYSTAPVDVENTIYNYAPTGDHRPRWGISVPLSITPGNPLGMILAGNDQTSIELIVTLGSLARFAVLAGGASAALSLTFTPSVELFAVPEPGAYGAFVLPLLQWAHVNREWTQEVTATGDNSVTLDNHDNILQVIHTPILNGVVNTDAIERMRFVLNRSDYRFDDRLAGHLRRQRRAFGKDIPAIAWTFFTTRTMRDAIRADSYTDIRSILTIASGTTIGTAYLLTAERRLVQLDARS